MAELTLCKDQHCKQDGSCPRFHAAVDEPVDSLLLDVWSRQFLRAEGGKTSALQACVFQARVRVPSSALQHLAKLVCTWSPEPLTVLGHTPSMQLRGSQGRTGRKPCMHCARAPTPSRWPGWPPSMVFEFQKSWNSRHLSC